MIRHTCLHSVLVFPVRKSIAALPSRAEICWNPLTTVAFPAGIPKSLIFLESLRKMLAIAVICIRVKDVPLGAIF